MALTINNNVSSLTAQNNLGRTSSLLGTSLERLSSGLRVNRGADGPAALVISEQQRAQISGLRAAIDNTSKATALVQTGEGGLNEINSLLVKIRSLAVDSANSGVNDASSLAANQAEIDSALNTINRIAQNTQFGTRKLFDGTAGFSGTATSTNVTVLKATASAPIGLSAVNVTTTGQRASVVGANAVGTLAADETLTINGVTVSLAAGDEIGDVITKVNAFTNQTGVVAEDNGSGSLRLRTNAIGSAASITVVSNTATGANTTGIGVSSITNTGRDIVGTIGGQAAIGAGNVLTANGISVSIALADTIDTVTGAQGDVNIVDRSLVFQIGAFANQTATLAFDKLDTSSLGVGTVNSGTSNLAAIDIRSFAGATDAIKVIDQAIDDITTLRGNLGSFQQNTLGSTARNLQTTLENVTATESLIRDTDYAEEIANFTKFQVQLQAGTSVLGNANQIPQLIVGLLRG